MDCKTADHLRYDSFVWRFVSNEWTNDDDHDKDTTACSYDSLTRAKVTEDRTFSRKRVWCRYYCSTSSLVFLLVCLLIKYSVIIRLCTGFQRTISNEKALYLPFIFVQASATNFCASIYISMDLCLSSLCDSVVFPRHVSRQIPRMDILKEPL